MAKGKDEIVKVDLLLSPEKLKIALESLKTGRDISGFVFEVGVVERIVIMGTIEVPKMGGKPGEVINTIKFMTANGSHGTEAGSVFRTALEGKAVLVQKGEIPPFAVQVVCTGDNTNQNGTYKTFKITELVQ